MLRGLAKEGEARVAELVDAHVSGACESNLVEVQVLSRAPSFAEVSNRRALPGWGVSFQGLGSAGGNFQLPEA